MPPLQLTDAEWQAIALSLRVALVSVAGSLPLGVAMAWLLARRQFPGKLLLDGLVHLPLVVPPVVVGYGLLVLFGRRGPIGGWLHDELGITLIFTWKGAALASAVMGFPLMVRAIRLSLEAVDRKLEAAARTLGAGPFDVFLSITLPLALPGVLVGSVLAFARGLGEFGATIIFVGNIPGETRTIPIAIYTATQEPGGDIAALRLSIVALLLSLIALVASELLARRIDRRMRS
ncbi:MAG TPA: molybdate ABC transporter permease subunit [Candidatus Udaeobacter sp.]|nr:molybdate ABC transporter permease subunit [Candidatus Udaeobacter sp.]